MLQLNQELEPDETRSFRNQVGSPLANSPPGKFKNIHLVTTNLWFLYEHSGIVYGDLLLLVLPLQSLSILHL